MELDDRMMGVALREAARGRPSPNPHVGAAVVRGKHVVSTGYHRRAGEAHAEVMALDRAGRRARGATLYVTFEPCNHFGRTPPCTQAILESGIRRVVIGCRDAAPHVPGAAEKLVAAGLEVTLGVREIEARRLVADFSKHITTGLPFVNLKAALTLDGRMATRTGDSKWITGHEARAHAHRLRDRSDAVMVGIGTVLADDPELTVRHVRGRTPVRVILDSRLRAPTSARIYQEATTHPVLVFHGPKATQRKRRALIAAGIELAEAPRVGGGLDLRAVLRELGRRDVVRLLVEGGPTLHGRLLAEGLADRASLFLAPKILGDAAALPLARGPAVKRIDDAWRLSEPRTRTIGTDLLVEGDLVR